MLMNTVAAMLCAEPAFAQAESAESAAPANDEIVVTAQRREERLVDVPISVSAIGEQRLENAGATTVTAIGTVVPNIQINETVGNSWSPLISIRGLAPAGDTSLGRDQ
ncbi:MAG: TonB-dependent receptor plug domain-containing protein, partial [Rhodospirillaceae bacterium]|nr:TonB-dependent receptor plug domain-containing protein [Rhodospirillaceae bacterium]